MFIIQKSVSIRYNRVGAHYLEEKITIVLEPELGKHPHTSHKQNSYFH